MILFWAYPHAIIPPAEETLAIVDHLTLLAASNIFFGNTIVEPRSVTSYYYSK
jgi:hypothetical protein